MRVQDTHREHSVRTLFLRRMNAWATQLAESAPAEVLAEALARPSARGSMIHVLEQLPAGLEKSESEVLRERALGRALAVREELRDAAGGFHPTQWVADHLGVQRQSVDRYRKQGALLALETPHGYVFPACQFVPGGIVPGLREVLEAMQPGGFWETLGGLVTPSPSLGGRTAVDALRSAATPGERDRALAAARAYAHG